MNRVAFYAGLAVMLVGLIVWLLRPNQSPGKNEIELFGAKFSFDTPAFAVMIIGLALMLFSPRFPIPLAPEPEPIKKIVCTGEREETVPALMTSFTFADISAPISRSQRGFVRVSSRGTSGRRRPMVTSAVTP
jgi:hypothetical protein